VAHQLGRTSVNHIEPPKRFIADIVRDVDSDVACLGYRRFVSDHASGRGSRRFDPMADVLLFHHALGLTAGVQGFAEQLRAAGHTVMVPDLYDGARFDTITEGVAHAEEIGFETLIDRGVAVAEGLGDRLVVAGFSLGVLPAQKLAQTRPGVIGAVLYHAAAPNPPSPPGRDRHKGLRCRATRPLVTLCRSRPGLSGDPPVRPAWRCCRVR
jgi:pimeloyl-ACP methyl ester carboxylesterase